MPFALKLTHDEPRLVYLALVYHLGRPGSELDATTMMPVERGLREVKVALGADLDADSAIVELDEIQFPRLLSALLGCVTELRGYHLSGGSTSTVARFTETAQSLFPKLRADPEEALTVAEAMFMLHRRMQRAVGKAGVIAPGPENADAAPPPTEATQRSGRWPFGRGGRD